VFSANIVLSALSGRMHLQRSGVPVWRIWHEGRDMEALSAVGSLRLERDNLGPTTDPSPVTVPKVTGRVSCDDVCMPWRRAFVRNSSCAFRRLSLCSFQGCIAYCTVRTSALYDAWWGGEVESGVEGREFALPFRNRPKRDITCSPPPLL